MGSLLKSRELEKRFNEIGKKIKACLKEGTIPDKRLFRELDMEFKKIKRVYEDQGDTLNMLHVEHNYLLYKSVERLQSDINSSFHMFVGALFKLIERHKLREYPQESFKRMLGMYRWISSLIENRRKDLDLKKVGKNWIKLTKEAKILKIADILELCTQMSINIILKNYEEITENLKITSVKEYNFAKRLEDRIRPILGILELIEIPLAFLATSMSYEILYKLNKKRLHYLVRSLFFEKSKDKKTRIQGEIDKITKNMLNFSKLSLKRYEKYLKLREKDEDENVLLASSLKELDKLAASYYFYAYSKKDIFTAWQRLDTIKHYIVRKVFTEKVPLSQNLITYFGEEWAVLYVFAKLYLLKEEVRVKSQLLTQEWEKEIFLQIYSTLEGLEDLFKYEGKHTRGYTLKIMTAQFSGGFSEYFIHELFREFFENGVIDEKTPDEFRELFECIKTARKDSIILNDHVEKDKPDIDIHIRGKCAVFLKNAKVDSDVVKQIWKEIELCKKKNIKKVFYGINFIKNLENIEYIKNTFDKIAETFKEIDVHIFDIKDLVSTLLSELGRCGKSKLNFPELDLYKVLDY
ncbi:hypothetical protein DRP04_03900 [Archaeoglobales archaeon]|nr:MAG: hypothetical protein DRP04_03900 [Archaeoglobales archaeon]